MWSVIAIAPRPRSRAVLSSTSTGVAQSGEWSVCMCRSTSISLRREMRRRTSGSPAGSWRRASEAPVDGLQLGGDLLPAALRAAGLDQLVVGREVGLQQLGCRRRRHRAGVEAAEEDLDQRPRDMGRQHPLLRRVEGGDVERVGVAQRRRGDAGREGLVDVDDVRRGRPEQLFDPLAGGGDQDLMAAALQLL